MVLHSQPDQKNRGKVLGVTGDVTGKKRRDSGEGWAEMRENKKTTKR